MGLPVNMFCAGVSCSDRSSIEVIDVETKSSLGILRGHASSVGTINFFPWNEHRLITSGNDNTVRIWDLATTEELACFQYDACVSWIVCGVDSQSVTPYEFLITKTEPGILTKRNLATHEILYSIKSSSSITTEPCVCLDGRLLLTNDKYDEAFFALYTESGNLAKEFNRNCYAHLGTGRYVQSMRSCPGNDSIVAVKMEVFTNDVKPQYQAVLFRFAWPTSVSCLPWMGNDDMSMNVSDICLSGDGSKLFCVFHTGFVVLDTDSMTLFKVVQTGYFPHELVSNYTGQIVAFSVGSSMSPPSLFDVDSECVVHVLENLRQLQFSACSHILM